MIDTTLLPKRPTWLLVLACGAIPACSRQPDSAGPPPRQQIVIIPQTLEEIARTTLGSAYRSARIQGDTVMYEYAPKQDGTLEANYNRIFLLGAGAVPATFRDEKAAQKIRLTALDPALPSRRLAVWSISRRSSQSISWQHLPPVPEFIKRIKVEYAAQR